VEIYFPLKGKNWPGAVPSHPWYNPSKNPPDNNPLLYTPENAYFYYGQVPNAGRNCPWHEENSQTFPNRYPGYGILYSSYVPQIGPLYLAKLNGDPADYYEMIEYSDFRSGIPIVLSGMQLYGIHIFAWGSRHEVRHHNDLCIWWEYKDWDNIYDTDTDLVPDAGGVTVFEDNMPPPPVLSPLIPTTEGGPYYRDNDFTHSIGKDFESHCLFSTDMSDWSKDYISNHMHEKNDFDWGFPGARWHNESSCNYSR
jgi:hypothetical protein